MKRVAWAWAFGALMLVGGLVIGRPATAAGRTTAFEATAYAPTAQDNYPFGATDYFGRPLEPGDVAVDPSVIPLRTCLWVTDYTSPLLPRGGFIAQADDEGDAVQGRHIDIFLNAPEAQVNNFGIQTVTVTILGPADANLPGTAGCAQYARSVGADPKDAGRARTHASLSVAEVLTRHAKWGP